MGLLSPQKEEMRLMQRMFEERVRLVGIEGWYYEVKNHDINVISSYDSMDHYGAIKIGFIFEEMPNPKTLRNLKWWDDSDSTTPPIAYLPWHIGEDKEYELKPTIGSFIEILDPLSNSSRFFEIMEVNANSLYLINSIVKLAPARLDDKKTIDWKEDVAATKEKSTDYEFISE